MKRLAFVFYWRRASTIFQNWRDGLRAAIELIGAMPEYKVEWFLDEKVPDPADDYYAILFWGDSYCNFFRYLNNYPNAKKGIFLTTDPHNIHNLSRLDAVYCESQPIVDQVKQFGDQIKWVKAFGTDTDFYKPDPAVKKDIPYFYPATFSPWKKQSEIVILGDKLYCVGTLQPDGEEELKACESWNVHIEKGYFPPEKIRDYYNRTQSIVIPAIHGSERTVLEAMAMNIVPIVMPYNERARSYLSEYANSKFRTPRDFIIENYSHVKYAEAILRGIE